MTFVDTHVLLYAVCPGADDRAKAETSRGILRRDDLALSVQVLQEFYVRPPRTGSRLNPASPVAVEAVCHLASDET